MLLSKNILSLRHSNFTMSIGNNNQQPSALSLNGQVIELIYLKGLINAVTLLYNLFSLCFVLVPSLRRVLRSSRLGRIQESGAMPLVEMGASKVALVQDLMNHKITSFSGKTQITICQQVFLLYYWHANLRFCDFRRKLMIANQGSFDNGSEQLRIGQIN